MHSPVDVDEAVAAEFAAQGGASPGHSPGESAGVESAGHSPRDQVLSRRSPGGQSSADAGHSPRSQSSSEDEQQSPASVESADAMIQRQVVLLGTYLAKLELPRPDLLRVTHARHALRCLRRVFRNDDGSDLYAHSKVRQRIPQFWSHSWHGNAWAKIVLLLAACNGTAAVVLGTLVFLATRMLIQPNLGPWPIVHYVPRQWYAPEAALSMLLGLLVSAVTLVTWPSRKEVFLDRICIHQSDPKLKALGVLSLAAFLKHSQTMLVCWDETYIRRMWCVVEMAAFLKCNGRDSLIIRPVLLGICVVVAFCAITVTAVASEVLVDRFETWTYAEQSAIYSAGFAACLMISFYLLSVAARAHFRAAAVVTEQLAHFSFMDDTVCHCCSQQHINASGQRIPCDREAMVLCLDHWFGSIEQFNNLVQQSLAGSFEETIGRYPVPYLWIVGATAPLFWFAVHWFVTFATFSREPAFFQLLNLCGWWLCHGPVVAKLWLGCLRRVRRRRKSRFQEFMINAVCSCWAALLFAAIRGLEFVLVLAAVSSGSDWGSGVLLASVLAPLAALIFLPDWRRCRNFRLGP